MSAPARASAIGPNAPAPAAPQAPVADHFPRLADPKRLAALEATRLLDSEAEAAFDRFTKLAARWLGKPMALVSLVDDHRQFFKSAYGLSEPLASVRQTPLSHSFCQYAVSSREPLVVADARTHPWLKDNLAVPELGVVAYAGVPLVTSEEDVLGAFCVIDTQPHTWTAEEIDVLRDLAEITMTEIELRSQLARLNALRAERGKERRLLHGVIDALPDSLVVRDLAGELMLVNPAAKRSQLANVPRGTPNGQVHGVFLADGVTRLDADHAPDARVLASGVRVEHTELVIRRPSAPDTIFSVSASPLRDEQGTLYAAVSIGHDITDMRRAERSLAQSEAILQAVVRHLPNAAVLLYDHDLRYLMADGEQLLSSIGFKRESLIGKTLSQVASAQTLASIEALYRGALEGRTATVHIVREARSYALTTVPVRDDTSAVAAGLALIYDITTIKREQEAAEREAAEVRSISLRDELTGLYNRRGFLQLARQALQLAGQMGRPALLFFVDLNGMKQINDQLGHDFGDKALVESAEVLQATFRGSDVVARLGGDEFVALLLDAGASQLAIFEGRVQREIDARNGVPGRKYQLSASVGGAVFDPGAPESVDELLARADALMYEQKRSRKAGRG